jgi:hypothetical protein
MPDPKRNSRIEWYPMREMAVIFLAISSLLISSCADLELPPDQPQSNHPHLPGSGDYGY